MQGSLGFFPGSPPSLGHHIQTCQVAGPLRRKTILPVEQAELVAFTGPDKFSLFCLGGKMNEKSPLGAVRAIALLHCPQHPAIALWD